MNTSQEHRHREAVVIYRLGSLGDTIVALPCFHAIERATQGQRRIVLTNFPVSSKAAPLEGILGGSGLMDEAIAYPLGMRSLSELLKLRQRLRAIGANTLYYLTAQRGLKVAWRDLIFFKLCGFRHIVGLPLRHSLQTYQVLDEQGTLEHEASRLARCMAALGPMDLDDPGMWDLRITQAEVDQAAAVIRPMANSSFMALNMGGKIAAKDWGEPNWKTVLAELASQHGHMGLLVVGAQEDSERAQRVTQGWPGTVVDACGRLSPRASAAAMRGARLFMGHDSGPMHLAAATGVPCIGLFGDYSEPAVWHPYGKKHHAIHCPDGVQAITPAEVIQAAKSIL